LKDYEAFGAFVSDVRFFQRIRDFLNLFPDKWRFFFHYCGTFSNTFFEKWRLLFRNVGILIIFEDFLENLKLFQGLQGFLNTYLAFIKPIAAEAFCLQSKIQFRSAKKHVLIIT
jgi:hypothetical protein